MVMMMRAKAAFAPLPWLLPKHPIEEDTMAEIEIMPEWRSIQGFPGYEVSNMGEVRSWYRGVVRILKLYQQPNGYFRLSLCRSGRQQRRHGRYIHTLVLEAFQGPRPPGMEARHLDGNKSNNRNDNLRFG